MFLAKGKNQNVYERDREREREREGEREGERDEEKKRMINKKNGGR